MDALAPCPSCSRHIRVEESRCPFCAAAVSGLTPTGFDPSLAPARVRAAFLAFSASMAIGACVNPMANVYGGPPIQPPPRDAGALAQPQPPPGPAPRPVLEPVSDVPPPTAVVDATAHLPSPDPAPAPRPRPPRRVRDPGAPVPLYGVAPDSDGH